LLIKHSKILDLRYFPGVSYYLVHMLSYSLTFQNLGIYMYLEQLVSWILGCDNRPDVAVCQTYY